MYFIKKPFSRGVVRGGTRSEEFKFYSFSIDPIDANMRTKII